ncbi:hypothetical protein, partial [Bacteroides sp. An269]|uniref:hypothetical protein n=1 Tax=Bacteroides sp. An269 TaxID=1965613 RepID=UPI0019CF75C4
VADNIVIFFRAKALSRNSFISTNPYKFAVKKQRLSDGDISTWNEEADRQKDHSKTIGKRMSSQYCVRDRRKKPAEPRT